MIKRNFSPPPIPRKRRMILPILLTHILVAWLFIAVMISSFFLDSNKGLGFPTCVIKSATGLPCPSCGMTRGVISISHGLWTKAFFYNPFSFLFYLFCIWYLLILFLPSSQRLLIEDLLQKHHTKLTYFASIMLILLMFFGFLRFLYYWLHPEIQFFP